MAGNLVFLKLGGSLVTDKTQEEQLRGDVLSRIAEEISSGLCAHPTLRLVVGHGSGSFGHIPAAKHGTRDGVSGSGQWRGFCEVSAAAARLNRLVTEALLEAGVPAVSLQPSASAKCLDGKLISLETAPIQAALAAGVVPVVYGDVAFDGVRGGTICSTEEVFAYLVGELQPGWLLLAGETEGVYGTDDRVVPVITSANFSEVQGALGGSRGTDVTGGMDSKVRTMLELVAGQKGMQILIFSGLQDGCLRQALDVEAGGHGGRGAAGTGTLVASLPAGGDVLSISR